ncbi:MAG: methyltransferase domain-containing protein [Sphingobacteriales bacterium]|nr:MAG: methyltransferase domain-containing protein [Sphingobacteriales bacterium]
MDDPHAPEKELWQNLRELEVINDRLGGYKVILNALSKLKLPQPMSIIDIGSGGGDTLRSIAKWAKKSRQHVALTGIDLNPVMTKYAEEHSKQYPEINYLTSNIFDSQLDNMHADVVTCSLFCHHFTHSELVLLLKRMYTLSDKYVIVNDLHRHWLAYHSIRILTKFFSKTYVVKNDAPLSVARAFVRADWEQIMKDADITNYSVKWFWAFRWQVIISETKS